jgi:hypothetical protein
VPKPGALHVLIPVEDGHEVGTGAVGNISDLARQTRMLEVVDQNNHVLPRRDIRAQMHR